MPVSDEDFSHGHGGSGDGPRRCSTLGTTSNFPKIPSKFSEIPLVAVRRNNRVSDGQKAIVSTLSDAKSALPDRGLGGGM